jgi:hypothetical protein
MSLSSWKREFYKRPAKKTSRKFALQHSLRKWIGLKPSNLKKHSVFISDFSVVDGNTSRGSLQIDDQTCALCVHFLNSPVHDCKGCPLTEIDNCCLDGDSPYDEFLHHGKVMPMIKALKDAVNKGKQNGMG